MFHFHSLYCPLTVERERFWKTGKWERGGALLEEVRHLAQWDQTLMLLWFEDEEIPARKRRGRS